METPFTFSNSSSPESLCVVSSLKITFSVWVLVSSLCVPISLSVFHVGFSKWKKRPSRNFSHSDVFTFNVILMEMCGLVGSVILTSNLHLGLFSAPRKAAIGFIYLNSFGQTGFQCLTCADRYLAVVFPVTYLRLRGGSGVTFRNITVAFVWLLCIGRTIAVQIYVVDSFDEPISSIVSTVFAVAVVSFCCVSVLCVLVRPKPGDVDVDRKRVDQTKRRAFNTMVVILGVLLMKLNIDLSNYVVSLMGITVNRCVLFLSVLWFGLPSSLVLPLLFLYRAGTMKVCTKLGRTRTA